MDQIKRRIINDEKIPHEEKIFSIYKRYIEWISKGKVATPVELGLKVCISQDQYGFIIDYAVVHINCKLILTHHCKLILTHPLS